MRVCVCACVYTPLFKCNRLFAACCASACFHASLYNPLRAVYRIFFSWHNPLKTQVTGHTATAVLGSRMMVLGGGNIRQFHSCRYVLVYDPIERTWSKLATGGNAPSALIYHRCISRLFFCCLCFVVLIPSVSF